MKGQNIGYVRVSSVDQNDGRQLASVKDELDKVFVDKCSGKDTQRPELEACLGHLREGDVLYVHSIDRLARNLKDLLQLIEKLVDGGVAVNFLKEKLSFTGDSSPFQKLQLQIIGACAEFEREMIRERQREGIALAKAQGKQIGRKRVVDADMSKEINELLAGGMSKAEVARKLGIGRATLYRELQKQS